MPRPSAEFRIIRTAFCALTTAIGSVASTHARIALDRPMLRIARTARVAALPVVLRCAAESFHVRHERLQVMRTYARRARRRNPLTQSS